MKEVVTITPTIPIIPPTILPISPLSTFNPLINIVSITNDVPKIRTTKNMIPIKMFLILSEVI